MRVLLPTISLAWREILRFARQRTRVIGALGQPVIFWVLFGAGLQSSFRLPGAAAIGGPSYQEYFLPGVAVMILLFTAIFSTISIIEDRRDGFLQGVLASPAPRLSIVLGKLCGGTVLAVLQAALFVCLSPLLRLLGMTANLPPPFPWTDFPAICLFMALIAFALTALGFLMAWPMKSTQGFHAIMSIFLMPMWLLSGAFFPAPAGWLRIVLLANPLSYGVAGLRRLLSPVDSSVVQGLPAMSTCLWATTAFALIGTLAGTWLINRKPGE